MGITRILRDNKRNYVNVDPTVHALAVIDVPHREIHSGEMFDAHYSLARANAEEMEIRFQTPNSMTEYHMVFSLSSALAANFKVFEGTAKTHVTGNALVAFNKNRNHNRTSDAIICHTPAGAGTDGTEIINNTLGAGRYTGGSIRGEAEWILKRNTAYLITITSGANSNTVNADMEWYEERTHTYTTTTTTTTTSSTCTTCSTAA